MDFRMLIASVAISLLTASCSKHDVVEVEISNEVVNPDYIGNGVEWDPYDEAELWGSSISDADWDTLFKRLDFMRPQYVRCMINSPFRYYDANTGQYDKTRNIHSISRLLSYCTKNDITVVFGEYNPPTWEMKEDQRWIDMSVDYLNYLVNDLGFSCIKHYVIFNEPDGDWASTNGDFSLWQTMLQRFHQKMAEYPNLLDKVSLAGPDVVVNYKNPNSEYDAKGWVAQTVMAADSVVGIYDVHSYPGQYEVRSGKYGSLLTELRNQIPQGKRIVLGEAGFKYNQPEDSLLMQEYNKRVEGHPYTKGSDCNMLCYDYFYGLDMPVLAMEAMNHGFSGLALWMLDDAMHSNGDSGKPEDVKIWGLWNILGSEVFGKPEEERLRPLFFTWSLMCKYFPDGTDILKTSRNVGDGIFAVAGHHNGRTTIAFVNIGNEAKTIRLSLPQAMDGISRFVYEENQLLQDADGFPMPAETNLSLKSGQEVVLKSQSFVLYTNME
jgi:hypothetical protein